MHGKIQSEIDETGVSWEEGHYQFMAKQLINSTVPTTRNFWRERHPELKHLFID